MNAQKQQVPDAGTRSTIVELLRRGESVERVSGICHVSRSVVMGILDRMVTAMQFD